MNLRHTSFAARIPLLAIAIITLLIPPVAGAVSADFFDDGAAPEALLSEMAIHPAALRDGTVTYIAYQGAGYDPYVVSYDEATETWQGPFRAGVNTLAVDTHGAPSVYLDAAGRVNVIYGGHNNRLYHSRTVVPGDISVWESVGIIDTVATYPQTFDMPDGRLVLFYRTRNYDWVMRFSSADRETFGAAQTVLLGGPDTWWYADFRPGSDGKIHAAFVWNDYYERIGGRMYARHNVYYMCRGADGVWRDVEGAVVPVPIDHATADLTVRVIDSGDALTNEITVKEDDTGAPCILFVTGLEAGPGNFTWEYLRYDAGWQLSHITTTDHFFDSGAFVPHEGGGVEALLVAGGTEGLDSENGNPRGRGGAIERWSSTDYGSTWSRESTISPDEPASLFADPQFVIDGQGDARAVFVEWNSDDTNFFNRMFLWGEDGLVTREVEPTVDRLGGARRADTAVEVSRASFPEGARTVVVVREDQFPDALTGVPLAHALHAPLLLSATGGVSSATCEEIIRLGATKAVLLGGANALGPQVEQDLRSRANITTIERVAGADRYDTARAIAERLRAIDPAAPRDTAFVVSGENWPDATTAAPLAATAGVPVVLTRRDSLPEASSAILEAWSVERTVLIGGEAVISAEVEAQLPDPTRVAGIDRYATSEAVARFGLDTSLLPLRTIVATGRNFPDALTGGGLAARLRAPVLLTRASSLPTSTAGYLESVQGQAYRAYVMGSSAVVSDEVQDQVLHLME